MPFIQDLHHSGVKAVVRSTLNNLTVALNCPLFQSVEIKWFNECSDTQKIMNSSAIINNKMEKNCQLRPEDHTSDLV